MMLSKKHRSTITEKNNLTTAGVHIAYKYLLHIRIKCCLHMHIKIALTIINSLLLFRLMTFKNHFTGKKTEKKSTLEAFKLFLCFIILGSANSFAFLNLDIFGLFFSPISFHAQHANRISFEKHESMVFKKQHTDRKTQFHVYFTNYMSYFKLDTFQNCQCCLKQTSILFQDHRNHKNVR